MTKRYILDTLKLNAYITNNSSVYHIGNLCFSDILKELYKEGDFPYNDMDQRKFVNKCINTAYEIGIKTFGSQKFTSETLNQYAEKVLQYYNEIPKLQKL